jgi:hypothetical protein
MKLVLQLEEHEHGLKVAATAELLAHMWNEQLQLFITKNMMYRDSWREQGWRGNVARILSKVSRIKAMLWGSVTWQSFDGDEPVEDTLRDLSLLCMFAIINRSHDNEWGEPRG